MELNRLVERDLRVTTGFHSFLKWARRTVQSGNPSIPPPEILIKI